MMKRWAVMAVVAAVSLICSVSAFVAVAGAEEKIVVGTTLENLMTAYNGEKNANARYLAFAQKASEEGYDTAASLFRAAAYAEQIHFERHAKIIEKLGGTPAATMETPDAKSTKENLEAAEKGEVYEAKVMYPAFLKQAEKEGSKDAIDAFEDAGAAEGVHAALYSRMASNLTLSRGIVKDFYVCPLCGNVIDALTFMRCPICATHTKEFKKIR